MSYQDRVPVVASADLSSSQFLAVGVDGAIAGTVLAAIGSLQDTPAAGEDGSAAYQGRSKLKAGGAITAGALVGVNSTGYFVAISSGGINCGKALEAVSSGSVFEGIVNFAGFGA